MAATVMSSQKPVFLTELLSKSPQAVQDLNREWNVITYKQVSQKKAYSLGAHEVWLYYMQFLAIYMQ